jgi:hypothetical protein
VSKEPRSRRICLLCGCLYGSHIDVGCIKVLSKEPRIDCPCKEFIGSLEELWIYDQRQLRINTLIEQGPEKIEVVVSNGFPTFYQPAYQLS